MVDRSIDRLLVGWSTIEPSMDRRSVIANCSIDRLVDQSKVDWSIGQSIAIDWSIDWLVDQLVDRLVDQLIDVLILTTI